MAGQSRKPISVVAVIAAVVLLATTGLFAVERNDAGDAESTSGLAACSIDSLPAQAEETAEDITAGGRYEYPDNDGVHFGNYEGILPEEDSDYYSEYTVDTPGLDHRGQRRIVTGGGTETDPEVWYYTDDHYESFCEVPDAE